MKEIVVVVLGNIRGGIEGRRYLINIVFFSLFSLWCFLRVFTLGKENIGIDFI